MTGLICAECRGPIVDDDRHTRADGEDVHGECCPTCHPCRTNEHDHCTGIGCTCRKTARCEANAVLTIEREGIER